MRHEEGGLIYGTGSTDLGATQFPDLPRPSSSPLEFRPFGRLKKRNLLGSKVQGATSSSERGSTVAARFSDAAPNGANCVLVAHGYKDFAPTELITPLTPSSLCAFVTFCQILFVVPATKR